MKRLALLLLSFTSSLALAYYRDRLPLEGVYSLNVVYKTAASETAMPGLDRLVILSGPTKGKMSVGLAESSTGIPFITIASADYKIDPVSQHILIDGVGSGQVYGQISLDVDPVSHMISGYFADSAGAGYKILTAKPLSTLADFLGANPQQNVPFAMDGVYRESGGQRTLIVRYYGDGSLSATISTPSNLNPEVEVYDDGFYVSELGVLTANDMNPTRNGAVKKVALMARPGTQPLEVDAQTISTAGRAQIFHFVKTQAILLPPNWSQDQAQVKNQAPQLKEQILRDIQLSNFKVYDESAIIAGQTYAAFSPKQDPNSGYSSFFIGYRQDWVARKDFPGFLRHHVMLATTLFEDRGLKSYYFKSTDDYEIAILTWPDKATADAAFAEVGDQISGDGGKFLSTVVWDTL